MAQLKEGSVIKKSTGDEIIATETQLNNHNTDVAAHNDIRQQINTLDADVVTHKADAVKHITSAERASWNAKQDALGYTPVNKAGDTMTGTLVVDGKNLPSGADIVTVRRGSGTNRFVLETQDKSMQAFLEAGSSIGLMGTITASDFRIRTNYLDRMSVSGSSGNVGIGTTSPSQKLDVDGKVRMRLQTQASDADDIIATKKYVDDKTSESTITVGKTQPNSGWWFEEID